MDRQVQVPDSKAPGVVNRRMLAVPYEYQLDNQSGTGYRECFSSTCAMISKYYAKVKNDDEYNKIRSKYGDSTNKDAQLAALKALGLKAKFVTNGNAALLENEIRNGRPVAVGWLHKGPSSFPSGGGHWTCCVGFTSDSFVFNDPNGEADMVNGGYISNSAQKGKSVEYSRKNWLKRWECDGKNTGWAILVNE
jgi:ABC-type bacteriocin/lantibiotic exporter with double-glycine peptidase domain